jgi:hypothetical protein
MKTKTKNMIKQITTLHKRMIGVIKVHYKPKDNIYSNKCLNLLNVAYLGSLTLKRLSAYIDEDKNIEMFVEQLDQIGDALKHRANTLAFESFKT